MSTNHKGCEIWYPPPSPSPKVRRESQTGTWSRQPPVTLPIQFKERSNTSKSCCTMPRLLQHNPETTAVARQKTRRAATPETSGEEETKTNKHMIPRVGKWHRLEGSPSNTHMLEQNSPLVDLKPVHESTSLRVAPSPPLICEETAPSEGRRAAPRTRPQRQAEANMATVQ